MRWLGERVRPLVRVHLQSGTTQADVCVSCCVLSPFIYQDGPASHLADATSRVTSCRKAGEGNPDRAQSA